MISDTSPELFDPEYSEFSPVSILLAPDGHLIIRVFAFISGDIEEEDIAGIVAPYLSRKGGALVNHELEGSGSQIYWELNIALRTRSRTVEYAYEIGVNVAELLAAVGSKVPKLPQAMDILMAGRASILIGQSESEWLEVKSQPYNLDSEAARIELAQDAARFANSESGGILIIGIATKRTLGGEVLSRILPFQLDLKQLRRYRDILDRRIFPPIDNLRIERVSSGSGHLLAVEVPSQREELKPFLVHGAIAGGRYEGAFISIVRRRGDGSIPVSAAAIHAWMTAGRALLRGTRGPDAM
ncbi:AlbA family DNA-binding domain-containing protein [Acrocarpospora macrocephala]|uniref:AlbA family DNA-binding domain-containing protein n=1 Tax=Acrocarpospora macrocephala TaxID=150177 RepID=UPI001479459F|nr:ATP-binding protein [Acrocarpospora macrocephala]